VTECLWLIYKLEQEAREQGGAVHFILGNHEVMALKGDHRYVSLKYKRLTKYLDLEYKELFSPATELGRWLRTKNTIEKIGSTLFVHGGVSPEVAETTSSLLQINDTVRSYLNHQSPEAEGQLSQLILGNNGPLWYRRYIEKPIRNDKLESILSKYKAKQVVIGHTIVNEISAHYDRKVYAIDVTRNSKKYTALLIEQNNYYRVDCEKVTTKI